MAWMMAKGPLSYYVGVDLGQSSDFTAITVVERKEMPGAFDGARWAHRKVVRLGVRMLERVPLKTPYPEVVERIRRIVQLRELAGRCRVIADATGVGRPVIDLLRAARLGCELQPVIITGADMEGFSEGYYRVPKRDLIVGLQVMLQTGGLQISRGLEHAATLAQEMADMKVKVTLSGREQYASWREGQHDDLVLALAMACWGVRKAHPKPLEGDDAYYLYSPTEGQLREKTVGGLGELLGY